jgi:hypothetical protein
MIKKGVIVAEQVMLAAHLKVRFVVLASILITLACVAIVQINAGLIHMEMELAEIVSIILQT